MNNYIQKVKSLLKSFLKDPLFLRHWELPYYSRRRDDNQLTVRITGHRRRRPYPYSGSSFMFVDDMYTGIMPFMIYRGEREKYPARIEPHSIEKERLVSDGISSREHNSFLGDSLCDFVRTTAHVLFQDSVAFYEIIYKKNEAGETKSFSLELLQPFYLFRIFSYYYQFIPWWEAKQSHTRVQIIRIPREKILRIDFPKQLGGKQKINKVLKRLWKLSKELIPKFQMEAMEKNISTGFDFEEFKKAKYLEIAKLTKNFGWNQRQYSDDYVTEYYSMLRYLREKKAQAIVRDKIISKLNEILGSPVLNLGVKVVIENIFTVEDVENQEKALKEGGVAFMDIFNALKI